MKTELLVYKDIAKKTETDFKIEEKCCLFHKELCPGKWFQCWCYKLLIKGNERQLDVRLQSFQPRAKEGR